MNALIDSIKDMFVGLSTWGWVGQIAGLVGFVIIFLSFQLSKKNYCLLAGIAMILFLIESTTSVTSMANFTVCLMSLIRNIWMYIKLKKGKGELTKVEVYSLIIFLWVGQLVYMTSTHTFNQLTSYFTPVTTTILTFLQNNKNYYIVKLGNLMQEGGALALYIISKMPFSIFREIILLTSICVSIVVMFVKSKHNKKIEKVEVINN